MASPGLEFFLLDDSDPTTLTIVDASNPLSTVNIGRNAPLDPVGLGLDFGAPTDVDTIYVIPVENLQDPNLASPGEIASVSGFFDWRVFTSDDQLNWTEQPVTEAIYSVFDNRFEISFSPGELTRFVKVVTTPITTAAGEIRIAELGAFITVEADSGLVERNPHPELQLRSPLGRDRPDDHILRLARQTRGHHAVRQRQVHLHQQRRHST